MNTLVDIARSTLMSLRSRDGPPGSVDPPGADPPKVEVDFGSCVLHGPDVFRD